MMLLPITVVLLPLPPMAMIPSVVPLLLPVAVMLPMTDDTAITANDNAIAGNDYITANDYDAILDTQALGGRRQGSPTMTGCAGPGQDSKNNTAANGPSGLM